MLESISGFRNWQAPKREAAEPVKVKDYAEAVKAFETDFADIKRLDEDASMAVFYKRNLFASGPMYGLAPAQHDTDPRKGEVEVPGVGSLHSTSDGFRLTTDQKPREVHYAGTPGILSLGGEGGHRDYQVNDRTGTITVTNQVGAMLVNGVPAREGFIEQYTIDTENGTIADYSRLPGPSQRSDS